MSIPSRQNFHADPHAGNLIVKNDGTLVFIDFSAIFSCGFLISGVILLEGPYSRVGLLLILLSALTLATFLKRNSNPAEHKRLGRRNRAMRGSSEFHRPRFHA